jgi:hypothetical protein
MIAGNCSAVVDAYPSTYPDGFYGSGLEYLGNNRTLVLNWNSYVPSTNPNHGFNIINPYNASYEMRTLPVRQIGCPLQKIDSYQIF